MRKNGSLPLRVVVRACDEDLREILDGALEMRFFCLGARCALRVTGAHQDEAKWWCWWGLGVKQSRGTARGAYARFPE